MDHEEENLSETRQSVSMSKNPLGGSTERESFCGNVRKSSGNTVESLSGKKFVKPRKSRGKSREYSEDPEQRRIVNFLRGKEISENLIDRILKNGLTDDLDRLLRRLGITNEEMAKFEWRKNVESHDCTCRSLVSETSFIGFGESMSPDNLYLKKHLGDILVRALTEIVKRKPCDPVDFLGHWLIDRKVYEERDKRRREFEAELVAQRKLTKCPEVDVESEIIDYNEREESLENEWNYGEYEESEMQ